MKLNYPCVTVSLLVLGSLFLAHIPTLADERDLLPSEAYQGGSAEAEKAGFEDDAEKVMSAQEQLAAENDGQAGRVFHRKNNGTFLGQFEIFGDIPDELKLGIFSKPSHWITAARFSGGVGKQQSDLKPDVMGLALKLIKFDSKKPLNNQELETMDWLMTNSPTAFGKDQREFIEFMEASNNPGIFFHRLLLYFIKHPLVAFRIIAASAGPHSHHLLQTYGSGHAYVLGDGRAMKFGVELEYDFPGTQNDLMVDSEAIQREFGFNWNPVQYFSQFFKGRNYLSEDLYRVLERGSVHLNFFLYPDDPSQPERTPVENAIKRWKTQPIRVARLTLHKQPKDPRFIEQIEKLGFNPGHNFYGHEPAGAMGRGRVFTYTASQEGRGVTREESQQILGTLINFYKILYSSSYSECAAKTDRSTD